MNLGLLHILGKSRNDRHHGFHILGKCRELFEEFLKYGIVEKLCCLLKINVVGIFNQFFNRRKIFGCHIFFKDIEQSLVVVVKLCYLRNGACKLCEIIRVGEKLVDKLGSVHTVELVKDRLNLVEGVFDIGNGVRQVVFDSAFNRREGKNGKYHI